MAGAGRRIRHTLRDGAARLLWALGRTRPASAAARRLTVITLHRVLPPDQLAEYPIAPIAVTPDGLDLLLRFAAAHYDCRPLSEALAAFGQGDSQRPLLAVTFDDGQYDNHAYARPVLAKHGIRASFFVPAAFVGSRALLWHDELAFLVRSRPEASAEDPSALVEAAKLLAPAERGALIERVRAAAGAPTPPDWARLMDWDELRELADDGHEIGSHSLSHELLPLVDDPQLEREVRESRSVLEQGIQRPVTSFCYPNGDHDDRVVAAVRDAGYASAVTTHSGLNAPGADPFRLRRVNLQEERMFDRRGRFSADLLAWRMTAPEWIAR